MKRAPAAALTVAVLTFVLVSGTPAAFASGRTGTFAQAVLVRVNDVRAAQGLAPLRLSPTLTAAAVQHTDEMARFGYFAHDSRSGTPFWQRLEERYPPRPGHTWAVGENIVWDAQMPTAAFAVTQWLDSPEHRANLLSTRWRDAGVGVVTTNAAPGPYRGMDVTIVTLDFGVR